MRREFKLSSITVIVIGEPIPASQTTKGFYVESYGRNSLTITKGEYSHEVYDNEAGNCRIAFLEEGFTIKTIRTE